MREHQTDLMYLKLFFPFLKNIFLFYILVSELAYITPTK